MHEASESEVVIRRLYQITNDYQKGFNIQVSELLIMGLERFNLDIGILSRIDGDVYTVLHCVTPEGVALDVGDTFDYFATYCQITSEATGPVSIEHCGKNDAYATHPAYQAFGLESYIGIPIYVDNEIYGTLNFSSATPYPREFKEFDIDVMKLMASWIEVEIVRRIQERKLVELNEKLEYQALYDPLTKLPNRRCLFRTLNAEVDKLKGHKGFGTLAMVDIDLFKLVNDNYGHQIGDDVLKKVANVLSEHAIEDEFVARFGGEEFLLWFPSLSPTVVENKLSELLKAVKSITLDRKPITVSIGACHFQLTSDCIDDNRKTTLDTLISFADESLYEAKDNGRDQYITRTFQFLEQVD